MATPKLGRFRDDARQEAYLRRYDALVERWPVPAEELDVPGPFGTTRVRRSGNPDGSPIVLVHPAAGTSLMWDRFVPRLVEDHLVLAVDTMGTAGRSVQTAPLHGPADVGRWLSETVAALVDRPAHLVGYSQGGFVAQCAAAFGTTPPASLIGLEPGGGIARLRRRFLATLIRAGLRARKDPTRLRAFAEQTMPGVNLTDEEWELALIGATGFHAALPFPRRWDDASVRRITAPTLLFLGTNTPLYDPRAVARRARALFPSVQVELVAGADHGLLYQATDHILDTLLAFTARIDATDPGSDPGAAGSAATAEATGAADTAEPT